MPHTLLTQLAANVPSGAWTGSTVPFHEAIIERTRVHIKEALEITLTGGRCVCVGRTVEGEGLAVIIERPTDDGKKSSLEFGLSPEAAHALLALLTAQLSNAAGQRQEPRE